MNTPYSLSTVFTFPFTQIYILISCKRNNSQYSKHVSQLTKLISSVCFKIFFSHVLWIRFCKRKSQAELEALQTGSSGVKVCHVTVKSNALSLLLRNQFLKGYVVVLLQ